MLGLDKYMNLYMFYIFKEAKNSKFVLLNIVLSVPGSAMYSVLYTYIETGTILITCGIP